MPCCLTLFFLYDSCIPIPSENGSFILVSVLMRPCTLSDVGQRSLPIPLPTPMLRLRILTRFRWLHGRTHSSVANTLSLANLKWKLAGKLYAGFFNQISYSRGTQQQLGFLQLSFEDRHQEIVISKTLSTTMARVTMILCRVLLLIGLEAVTAAPWRATLVSVDSHPLIMRSLYFGHQPTLVTRRDLHNYSKRGQDKNKKEKKAAKLKRERQEAAEQRANVGPEYGIPEGDWK